MTDNSPKRAVLLRADDWEGLFIDGNLVSEGHHLGEGRSGEFWLCIASKYSLTSDDLKTTDVYDEDDELLCDCGSFPKTLDEMKGTYQ